LHFFSRYSYVWSFNEEKEKNYNQFVLSSNLTSLRLVTFITIFGMSLFLIIDSFKDVNFSVVLASRIIILIGASLVMWISYKNLGFNGVAACVILICFMNFGAALTTATFARMPSYYLTNLLLLIFILITTASGLHFRHGLFVNFACLIIFVSYSQLINRDPFYFSQYPHLFSIFIYVHIVGIVLEKRRRENFLQFNDLAEQKRLVEELNQQKNKVISILSHDVASPLNSLSTILHLQKKGEIGDMEMKPYLAKLREEFNNVSFLLQSLVRWSRSQMHGFVLDKTTINMLELLEEKIKFFHLQLIDKNLELKINVDNTALVRVDEDMISIALRNLLSNAIKFARNGTQIQLSVSKNDQNMIKVRVTNQGEPIPGVLKDKLFTYQMPSGYDTKGERGAGLGLAMSAYFVRLNGGDIYLAESDDEATSFCMELPQEAVQQ